MTWRHAVHAIGADQNIKANLLPVREGQGGVFRVHRLHRPAQDDFCATLFSQGQQKGINPPAGEKDVFITATELSSFCL